MKPHKILIASVLKPADDVRMAWKIGRSIAKIPGTEVHVAGFRPNKKNIEGLTLHALFNFKRLSFSRALANARVLKLALRLRPSVFILSTHELLPAAFLIKQLCGARIIYDVRENYYRNIRYTDAFPVAVRKPLAAAVRAVEAASSWFIDYFLLAEKAYYAELQFVRSKAVTVENKYMTDQQQTKEEKSIPINLKENSTIRLLYSGTIAITYGIMEAIKLTTSLHQTDPRYELTIIGFAAQPEVLEAVKNEIKNKPFVTLIGGDRLVPHARIIEAIRQSDVGLLPYHPNPSTETCIPTKVYEYLANHLPVVVQKNPVWQQLVNEWEAGIMIDFAATGTSALHNELLSRRFYTMGRPEGIYWQNEEEKLLQVIHNQLSLIETKKNKQA